LQEAFTWSNKMISKASRQVLSLVMCLTLIPLGVPADAAVFFQEQAPDQGSSTPPPSPAPAVAPMTVDQVDSLVAPIALYPDALVAQVLAASMYPDQVAMADLWLKQNQSLTGSALASAVDQQSWDPSVKALTQFQSVLADLANNLSWTSSLGQAFGNQQSDVMAAVQAMRAKAQAAGTLSSTSQIKVVQQSPSTIVIQPANPQIVYVPRYNPIAVYGAPIAVPLYTPPVAVAAATVSFGAGIAIGAAFGGGGFVGGGGFSWGFRSWNCNWGGGGGGNVIYNHNTYINKTVINRTNNSYNSYHPWGPGPHGPGGYHPAGYGPNGGRPNGPNGYRPNGGYGPEPNGGRNGNHGLIGGGGSVQRPAGDYGGQRMDGGYGGRRDNSIGRVNRPRSYMSGNGNGDRAAANRGRASMRPAAMRSRPQRMAAPRNNGGGRRR
jgi:hypothetical protein